MDEIGEYVEKHICDEGNNCELGLDDAIGVCDMIAKKHGFAKCPAPLPKVIEAAFKHCDANGDGKVTKAEFEKCYSE